ncbi:MAG: T9SS type A sorting domain-containing protein [Saprospiraceae bacterium]|nr:T9SS type A sorting domain-containing protein [Saprospiraceae bacterium]
MKLQIAGCHNNETDQDWTDDYYEVNFVFHFTGAAVNDTIEVFHSHLLLQPQKRISGNAAAAGTTTFYSNRMRTDINPDFPTVLDSLIRVGTFTVNLLEGGTGIVKCTQTFTFTEERHVRPCSVCLADSGNFDIERPDCFPNETPTDPCDDVLNYAPDPSYLELTPIRYVKVMLHIFQVAPPSDPNQPYHGPQHFTSQHVPLIKSWIDGVEGTNQGIFANLCPANTNTSSPYISDSRIRFLLEYGEEGKDIFFHANTDHWGNSLAGCDTFGGNEQVLRGFYVTNPNSSLDSTYRTWIAQPENREALHIFISRGRWVDMDGDGPDPNLGIDPTVNDCFNPFGGGYTWPNETGCTDFPAQYNYGFYDRYLQMFDPVADTLLAGADTTSIGKSLVGEFFHVMTLDHISPFQHHWEHDAGFDGCDDTDYGAESNNMLGCDYTDRCHLSQCQLGRMHWFFENIRPGFQRYLVGYDNTGKALFSAEGNCEIIDPDIVITNGQTVVWNGNKSLRCNVVVKSGGRLTINCRVGMPEGASITVEKNGRLFLYGEVYNNCDDKLWQGIVVQGSFNKPHTFPPVHHGYFVVNQGGTIEGAKTSIRAESGAMVLVSNAFIRNSGGAAFQAFPFHNTSRFTNTRFSCNGDTLSLAGQYFHASLSGTRGIQFRNCDFSVTNAPAGLLSAGVEGDGSSFTAIGSRFTNLEVGIHAASSFSSAYKSITVKDCSFTDNHDGIITLGMQNSAITNNNFNIRGAANATDYPSGLMMHSSTGYSVEGNHFNNFVTGRGRYGTMTESSGGDANFIQRNFYGNLDEGNFAKGVNRGDKVGLQYLCNTDEGNVPIDFYVEASGNGIHTSQGNGRAAMNVFTHTGSDFINNIATISYYCKQNDLSHEPLNTSGVNKVFVQSLTPCTGGGGTNGIVKLTPTEWTGIENEFYAARTGWNAKKAELAALMDGGNTASLLAQINGVTTQTTGQVKQQLLGISPYLSNEALAAVIGKTQVLTENGVVQVLNANPDGLREPEIWNLVKASFSSTVANGILANAGNQTARTTKDNEAGEYRATMQYKADLLLIDIANDSLQTDLGLMRNWLAKKESLEADYAIVGSYVSEGDFTTADQKLAAIPTAHALHAADMVEHGYFEDLVDTWEAIYTNGTPINALDDASFAAIKHIADNSTRRAGAIAQGVMNNWYGYRYRVVPQSNGGQQLIMMPPPATNSTVVSANYVTAFPNPAKGSVTFQWKLPNGMESATITLSDLQGRTLEKLKVSGQSGKQEWSTLGLSDGIYLYHIKLPDGTSSTSKLAIIK